MPLETIFRMDTLHGNSHVLLKGAIEMGRPILLVDDEIDIREALCETLLCSGYEVTTAPSGHAAAQRLLENEGGVEAVKAKIKEITGTF